MNIVQDLQKIEIEPVQLFVMKRLLKTKFNFLAIIFKYENLKFDILINNTLINFKLKLNINQYIILNAETLIPLLYLYIEKK